MIALTPHRDGIVLGVKAQPGARRNQVVGEHAGALRVAVTAAPDKGKANEAIAKVLAVALGCKASNVVLVSGQTSRDKKFLIGGMSETELSERLRSLVS